MIYLAKESLEIFFMKEPAFYELGFFLSLLIKVIVLLDTMDNV